MKSQQITSAQKAMASIDRRDLNEIRSFANPPSNVIIACQLACLLISPDVPVKKVDWTAIKKWLSEPKALLDSLLSKIEPKERNYSDAQLKKIHGFIQQNDLKDKVEEVKKCSRAAHGILSWCLLIAQIAEDEKSMEEEDKPKAEMNKQTQMKEEESELKVNKKKHEEKEDKLKAEKKPHDLVQRQTSLSSKISSAQKAMASIDRRDLNEIRSFANPPSKVFIVFQLAYLLVSPGVPIKNIKWTVITKWLSEPKALDSLLGKIEPKERNYSDAQLNKIHGFIQQNDLKDKVEEVKKCSRAAHGILSWCLLISQIAEDEKSMEENKQEKSETVVNHQEKEQKPEAEMNKQKIEQK